MKKNERVLALGTIKPLPNGEPFEVTDDNKRVWHPNWLGKVDDDNNKNLKPEIDDDVGRLEGEFKACTCTGCWLRSSSLSGSVILSSSRVEVGLFRGTLAGQLRSEPLNLTVISMVVGPASFLPKVKDNSLKSSGTVSFMTWPAA